MFEGSTVRADVQGSALAVLVGACVCVSGACMCLCLALWFWFVCFVCFGFRVGAGGAVRIERVPYTRLTLQIVCLECLEQVLRFQSKVQKQWLGVLDASEKLSALDFFTLVLLYRVAVQPKRVLGVVKKHVKKGSLTRSLLEVRAPRFVTCLSSVLVLCSVSSS